MARLLGIDIGTTQVRLAIVRGSARKWSVEALASVDRVAGQVTYASGEVSATATLPELVRELALDAAKGGDPLSVSFSGTAINVRQLELPAAVRRRIAEVLPFELEAQIPYDIDDAVWDHRPRPAPADGPQPVLVVAARTDEVRAQIELCTQGAGREPDHVAPGAFALADLAAALPGFRNGGLRAILDLGAESSELLVLDGAEPVFARTLSRGVQGLPASAPELAREVRATFLAFRAAGGVAPETLFVTGGGAVIPDLPRWLAGELQTPVELLPVEGLEGLAGRPDAHRFARAVGIALLGAPKPRGLDLRRGPLAYERGYGFLREKVPLLVGLGAAMLVSFLFSTWARSRNLEADRKTLEQALEATTREVLGEATSSPKRVEEILASKNPGGDDDPLPRADAMDALVQISELVPTGKMKHDIEKLEVQRQPQGGFKVIINGIAPTGADVQTIEGNLKAFRCFNNPTVLKKAKAISDDRQKYTLETELRCPEEGGGQKKPGTPGGATSAGGK
ncbi:MAG: pilus assembly protein PilM [Myxococcales bacterium]|nr:pilus assembly protein PilM [Myxococcales bacterium]